jgi:hypothetical protein
MNPSISKPVILTTTDGKEREFLLTMGGVRRLKNKLGVKALGEIFALDAESSGVPLLYEALRDKGDLTEDAFADILPANLEATVRAVAALLGASLPEARPTTAGSAETVN